MARFEGGWVKVHRRVVEEDIGQRGNFTLGLFVRLLRMANWREGNSLLGRQRVQLKPGQIATSLRELSPDMDEDPHLNRVRNALAYLEKRGTIAQEPNNQGRIITILNWDTYQFSETDTTSGAQADHKQSTSGAQHSEEGKKVRSNISRSQIKECVKTWKESLASLNCDRPVPPAEETAIARAIQSQGFEIVQLALYGFRFEPKKDDYDPANYAFADRVLVPAKIARFVSLAAKNRPQAREVYEGDEAC